MVQSGAAPGGSGSVFAMTAIYHAIVKIRFNHHGYQSFFAINQSRWSDMRFELITVFVPTCEDAELFAR
jgi:hypothetical protein